MGIGLDYIVPTPRGLIQLLALDVRRGQALGHADTVLTRKLEDEALDSSGTDPAIAAIHLRIEFRAGRGNRTMYIVWFPSLGVMDVITLASYDYRRESEYETDYVSTYFNGLLERLGARERCSIYGDWHHSYTQPNEYALRSRDEALRELPASLLTPTESLRQTALYGAVAPSPSPDGAVEERSNDADADADADADLAWRSASYTATTSAPSPRTYRSHAASKSDLDKQNHTFDRQSHTSRPSKTRRTSRICDSADSWHPSQL
jgi:hypothetical protein